MTFVTFEEQYVILTEQRFKCEKEASQPVEYIVDDTGFKNVLQFLQQNNLTHISI